MKLYYRKLQYKAKWKGCDEDLTWYVASSFNHSLLALQKFYDAYSSLLGPLKNLDYWLQCTEQEISPEVRSDDGKPIG